MDDDHEMLLLGVEKQRNALSETDARLQSLNDARRTQGGRHEGVGEEARRVAGLAAEEAI